MRKVGMWAVVSVVPIVVLTAVLSASPPGGLNLQGLSDPDYHVRSAAVDRLVRESGGRVLHLLDALAGDTTVLQKSGLVEAVRQVGFGAEDLSSVSLLLESRDPAVRRAGVELLGTQPLEAYRDLCRVAADPREVAAVRAAAAAALRGAGPEVRSTLLGITRDEGAPASVVCAAIRTLAVTPPIGHENVAEVAASPLRPWTQREVAIRALADPQSQGTQLLIALTRSKEARVRATAAAAIAARGDPTLGTALAPLLTDAWPEVRLSGLCGLGLLALVKQNLSGVIGRLADADVRIVCTALRLLGAEGKSVLSSVKSAITPLLGAVAFPTRYGSAFALYNMGDKSGATAMQADALSPNPSQAAAAASLYNKIMALP